MKTTEKQRIQQLAEIILKSGSDDIDVLDYLLKAVLIIKIKKPDLTVK